MPIDAAKFFNGRSEEARHHLMAILSKEIDRRKRLNPLEFIPSQLQPKQKRLISIIDESPAKWIGYGGARGGAKALRLDALISTPFGFRTNISLGVGDLIHNPDGSVQRIIQTHPVAEQTVITLFFHDGTSADCSLDHRWTTRRASTRVKRKNALVGSDFAWSVETTRTIMNWVDRAKKQVENGEDSKKFPLIPVSKEVPFNVTSRHKAVVDPYLLGCLLGDGCISNKRINITSADIEHTREYLSNLSVEFSESKKQGTDAIAFGLVGESRKTVLSEMIYYGLSGRKSHDKFIPEQYKMSSIDNRYSVVQGLMDTDGTVDERGHISYTTVSQRLAEDVAFVIRSLGGVVTIAKVGAGYTKDGVRRKCRDAYVLYIKHRNPSKLFRLKRKADKAASGVEDIMFKKIVDYKVSEAVPMRCISVSNTNGLFLTNDFIVTHNSDAVRKGIVYRRLKYPGSVGVLFRRSLNDLQDNHITPLWSEFPHLRQYYNVQQKTLQIPTSIPGVYSYILFRHEEIEDKLIEMFQGKNYDDIFVDEASHNSQRALIAMSQSCRTTRTDMKSKFVLTMNPGGRSHSFIKRIFVDKKYVENERPEDYEYIQAYGWDNAYWCLKALAEDGLSIEDFHSWDNDQRFEYFVTRSDYGRDLNALNDSDRKAHLFGDWYVFAGQFFNMWSENNIIKSPAVYNYENSFPMAGGLDYGQNTVFEVCQRDYDGNITFFAEDYTVHRTPTERATSLANTLISKRLYSLPIAYDTDMEFNSEHYTGSNKAPIEIYREVIEKIFKMEGLEGKEPIFTIVSKKPINNKNYRYATNEFFKDYLSLGKMKFVENECPKAIETIPELVHDKKNPNGLDFDPTIGFDHAYDACKMAFMQLHVPVEVKKDPQWIIEWRKRNNQLESGTWLPGMG